MKLALAALLGALCALVLAASPALAARSFNSNLKEGFNSPSAIAFEANNDVWITDGGHGVENGAKKGSNGVYKLDAFPSQNRLQVPGTFATWGYASLALSVGVDDDNGEVFVSQSNGHEVDIFTPASESNKCPEGQEQICYTHRWTGINGVTECCPGDMHITVDNSDEPSRGRVYLSITVPENDVEAFDSNEHPVDFPATASYIAGNRLTGTPSGRFSSVEQVSVDNKGDLFVTDAGKELVDEFDSTGTFLRSFPSNGGVAVDPTNGNVTVAAGGHLIEYDASGNLLGTVPESASATGVPAVNSDGYLYSPIGYGAVGVFNPNPPVAKLSYAPVTNPTKTAGVLNGTVEPNGGGDVTECRFEYVAQGAFNSTDRNAVETLTISGATGGTFTLGFQGQTSSATGTGNLSGASGQGDLTGGSKEVANLSTKAGTFAVGQEISGAGIPTSTTIVAVGSGTLELSHAATKAGAATSLSAGSKQVTGFTTTDGAIRVGEPITAAGLASGTTITAIGSGTLELSKPATEAATATELVAGTPIAFNATAASLRSDLEAINTIGSENVSVTGPAGGPYKIEFIGKFAANPVPQLTADASALTPPAATASVTPTTKGGSWSGSTEAPCLNEANEEVNAHPIPNATTAAAVHAAISGLTAGTTYEYRLLAVSANGVKYGEDQTYTPSEVLGLSTDSATQVSENDATLNGSFVGNGEGTNYYFEYGPTRTYGHTTAPAPGASAGSPSGPARTSVSAPLTGLPFYTTFHYRVVASHNGAGVSYGEDEMFTTTPGLPTGRQPVVTEVHSDRAVMHGEIDPNGAPTKAAFEYVTQADFESSGWANAESAPSGGIEVGMGKQYSSLSAFVNGLQQGTLYHFRVEGTNSTGSGGAEGTFSTFPFIPSLNDPCPNSHVRQQTGGSLLLDCRAYELVSAANAGGYDVESNLVTGQTPFGSYPEARDSSGEPQVLYGVHDGGIPGTGNPTNRGVDPYLATRTEQGWSTRYVGIPANNEYAASPFSSTLLEASPSLETLAFGGPEICSPCFADGSTGTPIHLPNGDLVQGMAGSTSATSAQPAGFIGRHLSADGTHFVFGSKSSFASDGNEGEISIYDRNLNTDETRVVSKTPGGQTMKEEGEEIGELDISSNGSHVVIGKLISGSGSARYWHLYMDVGDSSKSVDLSPGTTSGALYDGMSADGSKVFFTTADQLTGEDHDHSPDIYEAEVSGESATLHLVSTGNDAGTAGEPGNADNCEPAGNTKFEHWNTTGSEENCGVVAVGGGGGVASGSGTIYFLSPELLDGAGNGVANAPNLYVSTPGSTPQFIATLESSADAPLPKAEHPYIRSFGEFGHVAGTAMDHATGDVYVFDILTNEGTGYVYKYDRAGHPVLGFGTNGKLEVGGVLGYYNLPCEIGVDNDPTSPNYGDLFVPDFAEESVNVYRGRPEGEHKEGEHLESISVEGATGIGVDPANGTIYVSTFSSLIHEYNTSFKEIKNFESIGSPTGVAVDSTGKVYVVNGGGFGAKGTTEMYTSSGTDLGQLDGNPSYAVAVDPTDDHVYVDEGNQVIEFNSSGEEQGLPTGTGRLLKSFGVSADSGYVAAGNPGEIDVALYGPAFVQSDPSTDNPLVIDSNGEPGTRRTGDFETTPSGRYAAFTSALSLTGYSNGTSREIYTHDDVADQTICASCNPTGEQATNDASMASEGLSLADDGRVFFNTTEGLVDRDLNNKVDAYEWEPEGFEFHFKGINEEPMTLTCEETGGCVQLVSSGTAALGSSLLGVSASGTDAYFFTRDSLVSSDLNGNRVKIYDARSLGGYSQVPPPHQCQASDECHGPGSNAPLPPAIKSVSETPGGNESPPVSVKCKKGFAKKHGQCARKPKHHHKKKHHSGAHHRG